VAGRIGTRLRAHLRGQDAALLAVAVASSAASLAQFPEWMFGKYPNLAAQLVRGQLGPADVADASPAYLLAVLAAGPTFLRWAQAIGGGVAVLLVHSVAARASGRVAAWIAAVLLAASQPWLLYGAVLEPDHAIAVLGVVAVAALSLGSRSAIRADAVAGAALGLSFALRPAAAPFALLAGGWLLVDRRRDRADGTGRSARAHAAGYAVAFVIAAASPVLALYAVAHQDWTTTMSAGQVFDLGHRPEGTGIGATFPTFLKMTEMLDAQRPDHRPDRAHDLSRTFAAASASMPLTPAAAERYWFGKGLAFARLEPWAFLRQLARKLIFTIAPPAGDADVPDVFEAVRTARFPAFPLRLATVAGAGGLLLAVRRRGVPRLLVLWVLAYEVVYLTFYFQERYALATLPAWCALAGLAVETLWQARRSRRLLPSCAVAAVPSLLLAVPFVRAEARLRERQLLVPLASPAQALRAQGRWEDALQRTLEEQAALPDAVLPFSRHGYGSAVGEPERWLLVAERASATFGAASPVDAALLAVQYASAGRCDLALPLAEEAAGHGFRSAIADASLDPDLLAADCLRELGRSDDAFGRIRRSLARAPGTLDGLSRAVAAATAVGDPGRERWTAEIWELHDPVTAHYALARARRSWGDAAGALTDADWIATRIPDARPLAEFERALALLDLGRTTEALQAYAQSLSVPFYLFGTSRFDAPVRALTAASPDARAVTLLALSHWMRQGNREELRALLRKHPELAAGEARLQGR